MKWWQNSELLEKSELLMVLIEVTVGSVLFSSTSCFQTRNCMVVIVFFYSCPCCRRDPACEMLILSLFVFSPLRENILMTARQTIEHDRGQLN